VSQPPTFTADPDGADQRLECSAKGCHATAVWGVRWNNPTIHTPERRKVWLACDDHRPHLERHLEARAFWRDTVPVGDLGENDG